METRAIETVIKKLGQSGCYGNPKDYLAWVRASGMPNVSDEEFTRVFNGLIQSGIVKKLESLTPTYKLNVTLSFPEQVEFVASSSYEHFPIQLARSRLESYLNFHHLDQENINLIIIGATEGFENAVKYNSGNNFTVRYRISDNIFNMTVENDMKYVSLEENIAAGKFSSTSTLMRGMLVMNKVFDFMDLNFTSINEHAILTVIKKL